MSTPSNAPTWWRFRNSCATCDVLLPGYLKQHWILPVICFLFYLYTLHSIDHTCSHYYFFTKKTKFSQSPCIANHPVAYIPWNVHAKLAKSCSVPWATWHGNGYACPWWPFWLPHKQAWWGQCILEGCIWPWCQALWLRSWCWQSNDSWDEEEGWAYTRRRCSNVGCKDIFNLLEHDILHEP